MTHVLPGTSDGENNPSQINVVHIFGGRGQHQPERGGITTQHGTDNWTVELFGE